MSSYNQPSPVVVVVNHKPIPGRIWTARGFGPSYLRRAAPSETSMLEPYQLLTVAGTAAIILASAALAVTVVSVLTTVIAILAMSASVAATFIVFGGLDRLL